MAHRLVRLNTLAVVLLLAFTGTSAFAQSADSNSSFMVRSEVCDATENLVFDGDEANRSVSDQVNLGPRIPGSNASADLRNIISQQGQENGWTVDTSVHTRHNITLTNLFLTHTGNGGPGQPMLVLSAHYDSRNKADQDSNQTNTTLAVPGANDGASGTAILMEFIDIVPSLNLNHSVTLFFNDAEDQNENYTEGAEAWSETLSADEIENIAAFVLLDMVGDADLQLHNIEPGNSTLKQRLVVLGGALGLIAGEEGCDGTPGLNIMQYNVSTAVLDDHVHPLALGIPSVNIMDPVYGEKKIGTFGTYWHTMEDTPDKVSASSLERVGRLVELGLRTQAFLDLEPPVETPQVEEEVAVVEPTTPDSAQNTGLAILAGFGLGLVLGLIAFTEWLLRKS